MILEFKTARNKNTGYRKYLAIDTEKQRYTIMNPHIITSGIEIKVRDYKQLLKQLSDSKYNEVFYL